MHRSKAGPRRRIRTAVIAAALAAMALPAAAQASVIEEAADGSLRMRGEGTEANLVSVTTTTSNAVNVQDLAGITTRTPLCAQISERRVGCAIGIRINEIQLGSGNDIIAVDVPNRVLVAGGPGGDALDGGKGTDPTRITYVGNDGFDTVSYSTTDRAVRVSPSAFDGRIGFDEDIIGTDVERVGGSRLNDQLTSLSLNGEVIGDRGDDQLAGHSSTSAITRFDMGRRADGADRVFPGPGTNFVNYAGRTLPVNVSVGFRGADDGEVGERDDIGSRGFMIVDGGQAGDTLSTLGSAISGSGFNLFGHGGDDNLEGGEAGEFLEGGPGVDTYIANGGNDFVSANDGGFDVVGCGLGDDTARLDRDDVQGGCENRTVVGTLRLSPETIVAPAGRPAQLRLSWRHPVSWRKLHKVELRVIHRGAPVGEVTIRPGSGRIVAGGAVKVARKRLTLKGRTVTARLALRLDKSLAGETLSAEVEATGRRGQRQIERDAATIRVGA